MLIYFLENDSRVSYIISKALQEAGYECVDFNRAELLLAQMERKLPDVLMMDVISNEPSEIEVIKQSRRFDNNLPILVISSLGSKVDREVAFDLGATDFLAKPFGKVELLEHVSYNMKKVRVPKVYRKNGLTLDHINRQCFINGTRTHLTKKEYEILHLLLEHEGKIVTKEQLFREVWQMDTSIATRTLDMHMTSLRKKVETAQIRIFTIRGVGYQI